MFECVIIRIDFSNNERNHMSISSADIPLIIAATLLMMINFMLVYGKPSRYYHGFIMGSALAFFGTTIFSQINDRLNKSQTSSPTPGQRVPTQNISVFYPDTGNMEVIELVVNKNGFAFAADIVQPIQGSTNTVSVRINSNVPPNPEWVKSSGQ